MMKVIFRVPGTYQVLSKYLLHDWMNCKQYQKELGLHVDSFHVEYKLGFPTWELGPTLYFFFSTTYS